VCLGLAFGQASCERRQQTAARSSSRRAARSQLCGVRRELRSAFPRFSARDNHYLRKEPMRGILLWLIGIPIPIIILLWLFGVLH
jgi:hypothetical protein